MEDEINLREYIDVIRNLTNAPRHSTNDLKRAINEDL